MNYGAPKSIGLEVLGVPLATAKLVLFFARNPTARPTVRELQRTLGVGSASAQRDLARLIKAGAVTAVDDGRLLRYAPLMDSPLWSALRLLIEGRTEGARPTPPRSVREKAAEAYGVDLSLLRSNLRLSIEERLARLDSNASFLAEARTAARKG